MLFQRNTFNFSEATYKSRTVLLTIINILQRLVLLDIDPDPPAVQQYNKNGDVLQKRRNTVREMNMENPSNRTA